MAQRCQRVREAAHAAFPRHSRQPRVGISSSPAVSRRKSRFSYSRRRGRRFGNSVNWETLACCPRGGLFALKTTRTVDCIAFQRTSPPVSASQRRSRMRARCSPLAAGAFPFPPIIAVGYGAGYIFNPKVPPGPMRRFPFLGHDAIRQQRPLPQPKGRRPA